MNYPITQKTGQMGELELKLLFISWSWTVGNELIDVGYDLIVEPLISEFNGHRFLVQVKATARHSKSAGITAPVLKSRLRQYAKNLIPVFIVCRSADGSSLAFRWPDSFHSWSRWILDAGLCDPAHLICERIIPQ